MSCYNHSCTDSNNSRKWVFCSNIFTVLSQNYKYPYFSQLYVAKLNASHNYMYPPFLTTTCTHCFTQLHLLTVSHNYMYPSFFTTTCTLYFSELHVPTVSLTYTYPLFLRTTCTCSFSKLHVPCFPKIQVPTVSQNYIYPTVSDNYMYSIPVSHHYMNICTYCLS